MRIAFAGTPAAAVPALRALAASDHEIVTVLTRPDAPVGRKRVLTPSPVKAEAEALGLPVREAARLRGEVLAELADLELDAVAVVAYGAIAGPRALATARLGWFNLHFSLLPEWRGAAPVQRALMAGQETSGLTVFRIDEGMDTGEVLLQRSLPLPAAEAGTVLEEYAHAGAGLLVEAFDALAAGAAVLRPQTGTASHAAKIDPAEGRLDFSAPAAEVLARYRGVSPAPGAWAELDGKRTKLGGLSAAAALPSAEPSLPRALSPGELVPSGGAGIIGTATEPVRIERIQPFGKPMMDVADFLRGRGPVRFDQPEHASAAAQESVTGGSAREEGSTTHDRAAQDAAPQDRGVQDSVAEDAAAEDTAVQHRTPKNLTAQAEEN